VWWGETDMNAGWHLRIPVSVQNPLKEDLLDAVAHQDVDLRALLLAAGWPSAKQGGTRLLHEFSLDEVSVRVVEYRGLATGAPDDGLIVGEVPSRASTGVLQGNLVYGRATNPAFHVDWVLPGALQGGKTRWFMIYLDTDLNGAKAPAAYDPGSLAPLDDAYWTTKGTRLVGTARNLTLVGIEDGTTARVEAYQFGRPVLVEAGSGSSFHNPVSLQAGEVVTLGISDTPLTILVTSDKPVLAVGTDAVTSGPVPSMDGTLLGTRFKFVSYVAAGFWVFSPGGNAQVTIDGNPVTLSPGSDTASISVPLSPTNPVVVPHTVTSDTPVLVFMIPGKGFVSQWPALSGGPVGARLVGSVNSERPCPVGATCAAAPPCQPGVAKVEVARLLVFGMANQSFVRGRDAVTGKLRLPLSQTGSVSSSSAVVDPDRGWSSSSDEGICPVVVHASSSLGSDGFDDSQPLVGFTAPIPGGNAGAGFLATPVGGVAGKRSTTPPTSRRATSRARRRRRGWAPTTCSTSPTRSRARCASPPRSPSSSCRPRAAATSPAWTNPS
jgi:hypothetical protein